jgi:hypothetical protein
MRARLSAGAATTSLIALAVFAGCDTARAQNYQNYQGGTSVTVTPPSLATGVSDLFAAGVRRDATGINAGAFTFLPRVSTSTVYDSNVYASPSNRKGDGYANMDGQLGIVSNWSRHALEFYIGGGGNRYFDRKDESKGYANAGVAGRLDVTRDLYLTGFSKYRLGYEPRGSGDSFQPFKEPITTQTVDGGALVHRAFNRLWTELSSSIRYQRFSDAELFDGTQFEEVSQAYRNGNVADIRGRLGYEFSPKTSAFVETAREWRHYNDSQFNGQGYKLLSGLRYELTRLVNAEVAVGYMHQDSNGILDDIDSWAYRAQLRYDITPLLRAEVVGSRDIGAPSMEQPGDASNRIESEIGVRADYAIRRDVTLTVGAGYGWVEYVDSGRDDNYVRLTSGVEYQLRPSLSLWANYAFLTYDSNAVPTVDYDKSVFSVGVITRY